jgi:hypothetical protein
VLDTANVMTGAVVVAAALADDVQASMTKDVPISPKHALQERRSRLRRPNVDDDALAVRPSSF